MPTDTRSPKRKLIDLRLELSAKTTLLPFARKHRKAGLSWEQVCTQVHGATGEYVTVPWLISQLPELLGPKPEAVAE